MSRGIAILPDYPPLAKTRKSESSSGSEWEYGQDYFERLEAAGFFPHRVKLAPLAGPKVSAAQGFGDDAELVLCFKFRDAGVKFLEAL